MANYNNPYMNMMPAVQQALAQQQLLNNPLQQMIPPQQMPQQQDFVTKEEFNKLMEENQKLKEQLEKELTQRADVEFFKKEQEVLKLDEGRRALQEVDYQKAKYFDMLWRTSPMGKETIDKYRDTVINIFDKYTQQMVNTAPVENIKVQEEQPPKKYNVVAKPQQEESK